MIQISSDSQYAVCVSGDNVFSMALSGPGGSVQLDPDEEAARWFDITSDGATVVVGDVALNSDDPEGVSLYAVPIAGGTRISLTPFVEEDHLLWSPALTPDGSRVVFLYWNETDGGLYSVKLDGSDLVHVDLPASVELLTPPSLVLSPDSNTG